MGEALHAASDLV